MPKQCASKQEALLLLGRINQATQRLIHDIVKQKPTQHCKAIIFQFLKKAFQRTENNKLCRCLAQQYWSRFILFLQTNFFTSLRFLRSLLIRVICYQSQRRLCNSRPKYKGEPELLQHRTSFLKVIYTALSKSMVISYCYPITFTFLLS